ncbi:nicotinate-nucleotide adenylyltransferase [Rhodovulum sp. BSW8]|uniref:Probable nicotinate-nucleotide adenylyltransferase n=1 Tax=Rhodovulum visakhapatnamense TaxID=364297 RepID=A0A4R8FRK2_9RHOB|nr:MULTISPECIES: nicotinate-nucleotide adenylyltransferase [Rhodovulum]OLS44119.1 nicotinic acid mononucleotide adenylyltransferase [Rhodovulum sulfidophilum]MBL3571128.1 nicotinate-nucleotide adenylyltransferase [Rhodovulum visakhapatnamense]MBL3579713.1 nicotinate-nucleotide adenylyltransferase [Rhodovulum visakhapatnamense]RBO55074.1 nicotinate-nucleotide adenylyltransferase [Rhodovulum sp. BSW8]TDX29192.1 nicotinate-nucleotide adenylyltransferase [Rhodovulum visakhapatnamense]
MRAGLPTARAGMRIGLLGGSFDPAHEGHAHITRTALKRFGLDRVWWLVSPGNPLKSEGPAPMARRIAAARAVMDHPRVEITDLEARIGTRYTAQTLKRLMALYPGVRFVWLMGADNLIDFHRWDRWRWILDNVPVGVLARPGQGVAARRSRAAITHARYRLSADRAPCLADRQPPAWCYLNMPMVDLSSSEIRARGDWRG